MRVIQVVNGLKLNDPSFEKIERTPEGIAIGGLPNWEMLLDPDYATPGFIRNRAKPNAQFSLFEFLGTTTPIINLTKINNVNFLNSTPFSSGGTGQYQADSTNAKVNLNPNAWTVFFVIKQSSAVDALTSTVGVLRPKDNEALNKLHIALHPTNGGIRIYNQGASDVRPTLMEDYLEAQFATKVGVDSLKVCIITFSPELGYNAYENGEHLGGVQNSKVLGTDTEFSVYRTSNAAWGMVGALSDDLSKDENSIYLTKLQDFLMKKYGI